ncbi:precorrin-6y C5,15-methyltransferase (decarboxylating) subunit CbiE [Nocardia takedensis]|uniref:precorrin-6y C5,15-methyltransferase (decarboxylating) subunit CbiE n=1 Tax=Nocardia takedensis TaxID=259390 RepID=UPI0002D5E27A|nr:precorrin-6y C5,15-methyltransferase (decarboxylating) subunit CbiE [Nocardia takedensis]
MTAQHHFRPDPPAVAWTGLPIAVVGIGADGWDGLSKIADAELRRCEVVFGSARQLDLLPGDVRAERVRWPSPLVPALPGLLTECADRRLAVLASGDPMFYGIGVTLAGIVGPAALRVLPQPSSAALACARLGWPLAETPVVSVVGRPLACVLPDLSDGRRLLVLSADDRTPPALADLLRDNGFGDSTLTVLSQLGGPAERHVSGRARDWSDGIDPRVIDPLNLVALTCVADPRAPRLTRLPGLPDESYGGDGQLTKSEVRALSVAALAPAPGELLWDIGGGSGTIAIEWCRTHPSCRAVSFETLAARRAQIADNSVALGVPHLAVRGRVPEELARLPAEFANPDAIFLGGGLTGDGLFETCWSHLRQGGRLVANAVTAESESLLVSWSKVHGGTLRRVQIHRGEALGAFTAWRPQLPITQWTVVKSGPGG